MNEIKIIIESIILSLLSTWLIGTILNFGFYGTGGGKFNYIGLFLTLFLTLIFWIIYLIKKNKNNDKKLVDKKNSKKFIATLLIPLFIGIIGIILAENVFKVRGEDMIGWYFLLILGYPIYFSIVVIVKKVRS